MCTTHLMTSLVGRKSSCVYMCCQWEQVQEKKKRGREMQDVLDKGKYKWKRMGIGEEVADGNCSG